MMVVATLGSVGDVGAAPGVGNDGACTGATGVTVVVDFQTLAGGTVVRCAPGTPGAGLVALREAGFDVRGVARFPGFVCRINSAPASATCLDTPPPDAYWSYWTAPRGGAWAYSDTGAASRTPAAGSVEGWSFSDGRDAAPRVAPPMPNVPTAPSPAPPAAPAAAPAVPTPDAAAAPSATQLPADAPTVTGPPSAAPAPAAEPPPEVAGVTAIVPPPTPDGTIGDGTTGPDRAPDATVAGRDTGREAATAAEPASAGSPPPSPSDGSPAGTLLGLGLVALLGVIAVVVVRRRRLADA